MKNQSTDIQTVEVVRDWIHGNKNTNSIHNDVWLFPEEWGITFAGAIREIAEYYSKMNSASQSDVIAGIVEKLKSELAKQEGVPMEQDSERKIAA